MCVRHQRECMQNRHKTFRHLHTSATSSTKNTLKQYEDYYPFTRSKNYQDRDLDLFCGMYNVLKRMHIDEMDRKKTRLPKRLKCTMNIKLYAHRERRDMHRANCATSGVLRLLNLVHTEGVLARR